MNEQVRSILAQETTKTSKIRQLYLLGIPRAEIARMVTNGNYGFVVNALHRRSSSASIRERPTSQKCVTGCCFSTNWLPLPQGGQVPAATALQDIPFLDGEQKLYYKLRTKKLSA